VGLGSQYQVLREPHILHIQNEDGGNSTVSTDIDPSKVIRTEKIQMTTIDTFLEGRELNAPIRFIKIDVENNEINVIQGAIRTLEKNNYPKILFEGHSDPDKQKEMVEYLKNILKYSVMPISGYNHMFLASHN
jgi:hypothetical protein